MSSIISIKHSLKLRKKIRKTNQTHIL